jgi:hypothetical protein
LVSCLAALTVQATPSLAQELEVRLRQGYDTNVYEVGVLQPTHAYYTRLGLAFESPSYGAGTSLKLRPQGHFTYYPQTSSGNEFGGSLALELKSVSKQRRFGKRRKTTISLETVGEYERALFLKRSVREELQVDAIDPDLPFQDLPSRAEARAELEVRAAVSGALTVEAGALGRLRDYVVSRDASLPDYDRLDSRELGGWAGWSVEIDRHWELAGTAMWRTRLYPKRSARSMDGLEVPGADRGFWYWDLGTTIGFRGAGLRNKTDVSYRRRSDRMDGYYSYDGWEVGDGLTLPVSDLLELRFEYAYGQREYDLYAPAGPPTFNQYHDGRAEVRAHLPGRVLLVFGPRYERTISNDPILDYERFEAFAEVRVTR